MSDSISRSCPESSTVDSRSSPGISKVRRAAKFSASWFDGTDPPAAMPSPAAAAEIRSFACIMFTMMVLSSGPNSSSLRTVRSSRLLASVTDGTMNFLLNASWMRSAALIIG